MKSTKIILALALSLAASSAMATSKHKSAGTLNAANLSAGAIAVGGESEVKVVGAKAGSSRGEAISGSIVIDDCVCFEDVNLLNASAYSVAVGNAIAGSIVLR